MSADLLTGFVERLASSVPPLTRRARLGRDYRRIFDDPLNRAVLEDILRSCGLLESSVRSPDPHETAYFEGRRAVGLELLEQLRWTEGELVAHARRRTQEALRAAEPPDAA